MWAYQVGLIKGITAHIRQYKCSVETRSKRKYEQKDPVDTEHMVVNREEEFKNVRCAVCSYLAQEEKKWTRVKEFSLPTT